MQCEDSANVILDEQRKIGFNAPILDLLDLSDPDVKNYILDDSKIYNLVKKENIEKILKIKIYLTAQVNFYLIF